MGAQIFLGVLGLCLGIVVAGGTVALLIGLGIVPRYAGITHTAEKILLYEDFTLWGAVAGVLVFLFQWEIPLGAIGLLLFGLFSGIFLGSWIMALAEMTDVFPVLLRRMKIQVGVPWIIVTIAVAKTLGSLFFFYKRW